MKISVIVLCTFVLFVPATASGAQKPIHFASWTMACRTTDIHFSVAEAAGDMTFASGAADYLDASTRGAWVDTGCTRIRQRTQPRAILPRPSYSGGGAFDCPTSSPVVLHVHYLRSGGQITGVYASARTRSGRYIAAGLLTQTGTREFTSYSCIGT